MPKDTRPAVAFVSDDVCSRSCVPKQAPNRPSFDGRAPSANGHEALRFRMLNVADAVDVLHFCAA